MTVKELVPMPPEAFRSELQSRGWTPQMLSERWGMTKRRVMQIIADADRPRYYDDAARGLPMAVNE
ncbi:hypothetical protein [Halomonas casei]|uniref:hypothetical protein n=1 Tax=Halomonas casei TaxID=2742613 RepID=UPI003CEC2040